MQRDCIEANDHEEVSAMFKKILFPVDFSKRCDGAAEYVRAYALANGAEIFLLHVLDLPDYLFGVPEYPVIAPVEIREAQREQGRKRLQQYFAEEFAGLNVHRLLVEGDPAREVVKFADEQKVDVIMLPTHGLGAFRRFIIGSTAAKILHDAHCPVWTSVHAEEALPLDGTGMRNVVCGIDLGPLSDSVLAYADRFARKTGADLTLVHAIPVVEVRPASYFDVDFAAQLAADARTRIDELQKRLGTQYRVCIHGGDPAEVMRVAAHGHSADLAIVGRGHVTEGLGRLRTHSYAVINKSPCPVLSV
jgi:nucleotide-binding universal stress UspA family protein